MDLRLGGLTLTGAPSPAPYLSSLIMQSQEKLSRRPKRRGAVAVLTALLLVGLLAVLAFSLDLGVVFVAQGEMQRAADAAALAAAWRLAESNVSGAESESTREWAAKQAAINIAAANFVLGQSPSVDTSDVVLGEYSDLEEGSGFNAESERPNAVRVTVRRTSESNDAIPLFFARVLGRSSLDHEATATAAVATRIKGFRIRTPGETLNIIPITLDQDSWNNLMGGGGTDDFTWDAETGEVQSGGDGIPEVNLFPQDTGSSGNRGTVDIGGSNNSTNDIARQILHGVTQADLDAIGGALELDDNGELFLNGDTGISAGVKDELAEIIGKPRIIPVFREVHGPGNNAMYTIVNFVGVRVMYVKLTGPMNKKRVMIQPATIVSKGIIPATEAFVVEPHSYVASPAWIIN